MYGFYISVRSPLKYNYREELPDCPKQAAVHPIPCPTLFLFMTLTLTESYVV